MAKPDDVVRRGSGATDVVDLDRVVVRQSCRVDEDDRHARPADLLDLGMVVPSPMATTPSTVARPSARASDPYTGEMKWRA